MLDFRFRLLTPFWVTINWYQSPTLHLGPNNRKWCWRKDPTRERGHHQETSTRRRARNQLARVPSPTRGRGKRRRRWRWYTMRALHWHQSLVARNPPIRGHQRKTVKSNYSRMSFNYSHIPPNTTTPFLLISLGKPPHFMVRIILGGAIAWRDICTHSIQAFGMLLR